MEKFGFTIDEACEFTGIGRRMLYDAIRQGKLRRKKLGKRTLLVRSELERFVTELPEGTSSPTAKPT